LVKGESRGHKNLSSHEGGNARGERTVGGRGAVTFSKTGRDRDPEFGKIRHGRERVWLSGGKKPVEISQLRNFDLDAKDRRTKPRRKSNTFEGEGFNHAPRRRGGGGCKGTGGARRVLYMFFLPVQRTWKKGAP